MRRYIRHPSDIPIAYYAEKSKEHFRESLKNISTGGVAFRSREYIQPGSSIVVYIPVMQSPLKIPGLVVWCHKKKTHYAVGLKFVDQESEFRMRMVEQVCHIEHYKKEILKKEGRLLSGDEAALEWIERYAKDFPELV